MLENCSLSTLQRLPIYLHYLKGLDGSVKTISSTQIASALKMGEVQVRKDLSAVSAKGKPKIGYTTQALIDDLENALGCKETTEAIIVGVGRLGQALLEYRGFEDYGLNILAGFDIRDELFYKEIAGKTVLPTGKLDSVIEKLNIKLAILTCPAAAAQLMADVLVGAGIKGIWNFTPTHIVVPEGVAIQNENLAASLAVLSMRMKQKQ